VQTFSLHLLLTSEANVVSGIQSNLAVNCYTILIAYCIWPCLADPCWLHQREALAQLQHYLWNWRAWGQSSDAEEHWDKRGNIMWWMGTLCL